MRTLPTSLASTLTTTLCLSSTLAVLALLHVPAADLASAYAPSAAGVERPSLAGRLLVASPGLDDPYFTGTVIYMLADDEDGALGVVINRHRDHEEHQRVALWDGGPVGRERVFVLHDDLAAETSVRIGDVAVASDPAILDELFAGTWRGQHAKVFVGYAGWGPGQLDREISEGAWRTTSAHPSVLFASEATAVTTSTYAQLDRSH